MTRKRKLKLYLQSFYDDSFLFVGVQIDAGDVSTIHADDKLYIQPDHEAEEPQLQGPEPARRISIVSGVDLHQRAGVQARMHVHPPPLKINTTRQSGQTSNPLLQIH